MIVCDTSGILAAIDRTEYWHLQAKAVVESEQGPFLLSPFVLAELDYLLAKHVGPGAPTAFLAQVASGAYRLEPFEATDVAAAVELIEKYKDLSIGLADASIVILAARHASTRILTLDERRFRAVRSMSGKPFQIFPRSS